MTNDEMVRRGGLDFVLPIIKMGSFLDIMDFNTFRIVWQGRKFEKKNLRGP